MEVVRERTGMEKNFFELCRSVVSGLELELYDLEYLPGSGELRVYIKGLQSNSVKIEDCVRVDQALTPFIDELEWMPSKLTLEVSSPGLYRKLREREHFAQAIGETVLLELSKAITDKNIKKVRGKLLSCTNEAIEVEWQIDRKNGNMGIEIPFANIKKASLDPDFNQLMSEKISEEVKA
ncbi:MAG: hypothetical protein A2X86_16820 [Bdellovibrionales bacterium GWA2_49_15]|nr:MAG: hypothetical protein A2X86_16820 [Bdellovibrionales bacterium GWA2_49_15]HAZ12462.1 hypothetical protein [Bdellovibrionales bacterium]